MTLTLRMRQRNSILHNQRLGKQLKILEDELSVLLFVRKNNNLLALSPMGKEVHKIASDILGQVDKIKKYCGRRRS